MSTNDGDYFTHDTCLGKYTRVAVRRTTGKNILGDMVTTFVEDWKCDFCDNSHIRLFRGTDIDALKVNYSLKEEGV
jgi:hypothetical protein